MAPSLAITGSVQFSSVQLLSHVQSFVTPWTVAHQASLSITISRSSLKLMSIELVMSSNHLVLCHPLLLLPSVFPSFRVFSNESVLCIRWPKYWNFSFSISPSNEYSGLISFRMDCSPRDSQESSPTPIIGNISSVPRSRHRALKSRGISPSVRTVFVMLTRWLWWVPRLLQGGGWSPKRPKSLWFALEVSAGLGGELEIQLNLKGRI